MSNVPSWLQGDHEKELWRKPWTVSPSSPQSADFKKRLWDHGFASPHLTRREAGSKDGTPVPDRLRHKCQYHAFKLERVRHECGDKPMTPLSWYRSPSHNANVGGVSNSQHLEAWATDWDDATRARLGGEKFDNAMERAFANGGRGYVGRTGGPVRHVDNGTQRTWVYA